MRGTSASRSSWRTSSATSARTSTAVGSISRSRTSSGSVSPERDLEQRRVDDRVRDLLRFEIARVRRLERAARPGIDLLDPTSRPCIEAARILYCGIVDEVERIDFQVFDRRARVSSRRRLQVAGRAWVDAARARRASR